MLITHCDIGPYTEPTHPILIGGTTEFYDSDIDDGVNDIDEVWIFGVETEVWISLYYIQDGDRRSLIEASRLLHRKRINVE